MWLESIKVGLFRNFADYQDMAVERDVTCLIGKNESGKTTILKALHRLNSANNPDSFHETKDYPRHRLARDRRQAGGSLRDVVPIRAYFALEDEDVKVLSRLLGDVSLPPGARVTAWRTYGDELRADIICELRDVVEAVCDEAGVDEDDRQPYLKRRARLR